MSAADACLARLARWGARGAVAEELAAYLGAALAAGIEAPGLPLPDEPHLEVWREYEQEAASAGALAVLARRLVQLRFPVRAGISADAAYRQAVRRGVAPLGPVGGGPAFVAPEAIRLEIHPSAAGALPVLLASNRADFVTLVQVLSARNEPVAVPPAMGACLVSGLVNWDRVRRHREAWEAALRAPGAAAASWPAELRRLGERKDRVQDRILLASDGPYSAVGAVEVGLAGDEWCRRSLVLRREHEFTHYLTLRLFGVIRPHAADELIADFTGLAAAWGGYPGALARRFLGLENFPAYRPGGRLEHYRGRPPLSDDAFSALTRLAVDATATLEELATAAPGPLSTPAGRGRAAWSLHRRTLDELAQPGAAAAVAAELAAA